MTNLAARKRIVKTNPITDRYYRDLIGFAWRRMQEHRRYRSQWYTSDYPHQEVERGVARCQGVIDACHDFLLELFRMRRAR